MDTDLRFQLPEEGADAERIAVLSGYLRPEVLQLDVEDVRGASGWGAAAQQTSRAPISSDPLRPLRTCRATITELEVSQQSGILPGGIARLAPVPRDLT